MYGAAATSSPSSSAVQGETDPARHTRALTADAGAPGRAGAVALGGSGRVGVGLWSSVSGVVVVEGVVVPAQQGEAVEVGAAVVSAPVVEVVDFAGPGWCGTARSGAVAVPFDDRPALGW